MKKIICIMLAMVMLLLSSCSTTVTTSINTKVPETTENTPITVPIYEATETTEPEPTVDLKSIRYTINVRDNPSMIKSEDVVLDHNGNTLAFSTEFYLPEEFLWYGKIQIPGVAENKTLKINDNEFDLDFVETFMHNIVENEVLYISHYEYSDDIVQIKGEFIEKRLIGLTYTLKNNEEKGNFTVEEAVRKAKEYLSSLYYYDINMDKYVLSYITKGNGTISLAYNCSDTGEELYIDFDSMGRIIGFDIKSSKIFEPQDIALWEEKVENAKKAVSSSLSEQYSLEGTPEWFYIEHETGKILLSLYVQPIITTPDPIFPSMEAYLVYVNIE